jgi:hypothetical protein
MPMTRCPTLPPRRLTGLLLVAVATSAAAAPPAPGRYDARLCVQSLADAAKPADCGPVDLLVQRGNRAQLRVADLVYRLQWHSSQVDVVLMHGSMQIDGFTAFYEWKGTTLEFADRDQRLRYEVLVGDPDRPGR